MNRCNLELQHLWAEFPCLQINPPDLMYPTWWVHIFLNLLFTIHNDVTPTYLCWLTVTYLAQAWVPHALWHSWPSFPQGLGGWIQLPKGCRAAWSPDSKTCLPRGSNGRSITAAVTLELKWKCSWCDNCSRKQKGQGQKCLFIVTEIFVYPKVTKLTNSPTTAREGHLSKRKKLTLKKVH